MTNNESDRLFEVAADTRGEPYEQDDLRQRTGFQSRAPRAGADFKEIALHRVIKAGAEIVRLNFEIDDIPVDAEVRGPNNRSFLVLARGTPYEHAQSGVRKTDTLEKAGFRAIHLARCQELPIILITSDLPERSSKAGRYLSKLTNDVWDVVAYRADLRGFHRLQRAFGEPVDGVPPESPWRSPMPSEAPTLLDASIDPTTDGDSGRAAVNQDRTPQAD